MTHLSGVNTQLENLNPLLQIHQEDFRCRVVDHQRAATRCGEQDFRHFFTVGIGRGRNRQHHARDRVRERPVDKLLGNKRLVRHDYLFTVPVADGGGAGVNFRHATGKIADRYRIANANRFFEQDDQARDKVGENFLQTKTETNTERGNQPLQFRPLNTNHREADQPANQHQQIFGDGGDGVTRTRR